jgi:hypothetical protein
MSVLAQKNYFADKKPFFKHFQPKDMAITAVRSIAIQGLLVFNGYVASLELEEESDHEDDKKPEFEAPSLEEFSSNCTKSFLKSLSITTSLRSLEFVSIRIFHPQIVGKLIKGW